MAPLGKTGIARWIVPDVAGIYFFMGFAFAMAGYTSIRSLFYCPEVFIRKDTREDGYPLDPAVVEAALNWRESIYKSWGELYPYTPFVYNAKFSKVDSVRDPPESIIEKYATQKKQLESQYSS
eukprot:TRINITY_DN1572_c0_g1_i1.p2 TRINITY_DN1572_c0_g1~~TRINITY_DN1572_c0_g1_i1.p2  ORF type:complete len:123 (+),score=14.85 TRINITY_DN1572_c0_g1_i1:116-484(+)